MRIIAGEWRRRLLKAPEGDTTRPTADRVRETLFAMLTSRLGSFEGLSVENEAGAIRALRANIANLRAQQRCEVRAGSVMQLGPAKAPYELILLDPPYHSGAGAVALDRLARLGWIGEATWIALETASDEKVVVKALEIEAERKVGKARLNLLRPPAQPE